MAYVFTRQQLYELVWSDPISTLPEPLAISDVGLAKVCRRGDIPLSPRGYWAKLHAGRHVSRTPLSLLAPGASDHIEVGAADHGCSGRRVRKIGGAAHPIHGASERRDYLCGHIDVAQTVDL